MRIPYRRSGLRTYLLIIGIISCSSSPAWILKGLVFFLLGMSIRIWAKGCLHQMQEVTISGPYRFVRHPFYLGNFFLDMGICIMSGFVPLMVVAPFIWLAVYIPKIKKEEEAMLKRFGNAYREYQKSVYMLIPLKKAPYISGRFSWKNPNLLGTELPRSLRFICYPLLFLLTYMLRDYKLEEILLQMAVLTSLIACLYIVSVEIKAVMKKRSSLFRTFDNLDHIAIGIIVLGFSLKYLEIEYDHIIWPLGIGLILFSFFFKNIIISNWIRTFGLLTIFEIPWVTILVSPLYVSLLLKKRYKMKKNFQYSFLLIGLVLGIVKEIYFS